MDYTGSCSLDITTGDGMVACFFGDFTPGTQVQVTLNFLPTVAQNLSVSGYLLFDDTNMDGDSSNNAATSCMSVVSNTL